MKTLSEAYSKSVSTKFLTVYKHICHSSNAYENAQRYYELYLDTCTVIETEDLEEIKKAVSQGKMVVVECIQNGYIIDNNKIYNEYRPPHFHSTDELFRNIDTENLIFVSGYIVTDKGQPVEQKTSNRFKIHQSISKFRREKNPSSSYATYDKSGYLIDTDKYVRKVKIMRYVRPEVLIRIKKMCEDFNLLIVDFMNILQYQTVIVGNKNADISRGNFKSYNFFDDFRNIYEDLEEIVSIKKDYIKNRDNIFNDDSISEHELERIVEQLNKKLSNLEEKLTTYKEKVSNLNGGTEEPEYLEESVVYKSTFTQLFEAARKKEEANPFVGEINGLKFYKLPLKLQQIKDFIGDKDTSRRYGAIPKEFNSFRYLVVDTTDTTSFNKYPALLLPHTDYASTSNIGYPSGGYHSLEKKVLEPENLAFVKQIYGEEFLGLTWIPLAKRLEGETTLSDEELYNLLSTYPSYSYDEAVSKLLEKQTMSYDTFVKLIEHNKSRSGISLTFHIVPDEYIIKMLETTPNILILCVHLMNDKKRNVLKNGIEKLRPKLSFRSIMNLTEEDIKIPMELVCQSIISSPHKVFSGYRHYGDQSKLFKLVDLYPKLPRQLLKKVFEDKNSNVFGGRDDHYPENRRTYISFEDFYDGLLTAHVRDVLSFERLMNILLSGSVKVPENAKNSILKRVKYFDNRFETQYYDKVEAFLNKK